MFKNLLSVIIFSVIAALLSACSRTHYVESASGEKIAVAKVTTETGTSKYVTAVPDADTGTHAEVPATQVQSQLEFTPAAEDAVENTLAVGKAQGGWLGAVSSGLLLLWGCYKSRKANATKLTLSSIVSGVSDVLQAARIAVANGQKLTEEDVKSLLKAAQNDAGTREAVRKLLEEQKHVAQGAVAKLWDKIKAALF